MTISALWGWADSPPTPTSDAQGHSLMGHLVAREQLDTFLHPGPHGGGWARVAAQWTLKFIRDFAHYPNMAKTQSCAELRVEGSPSWEAWGRWAEPCSTATGSRVLQGGMCEAVHIKFVSVLRVCRLGVGMHVCLSVHT